MMLSVVGLLLALVPSVRSASPGLTGASIEPEASVSSLSADDNPSLDPREGKKGTVYKWKASDGLDYEYFVPDNYDPKVGANLTLVLHGNGLNHRWTFWNHKAGEFRADDIVVSPDGTSILESTQNPEFLSGQADLDRLHALIEELKSVWKVRQTFLYGHSQGSFFVFFYAGEYPDDIDGVCGHAGAGWSVTQNKKGHHVAIGFMHGTDDHIPYWQASSARKTYVDAKYPNTHLRTLFDWPHAPHAYQAENVLSWCEGMTSEDPARVEVCLDYLAQPDRHMGADWSAIWSVADRLSSMKEATVKQQRKASRIASAVDELCADHLKEITKELGKKGKVSELTKGSWSGRFNRLVAEFEGVPALVAFEKKNKRAMESLEKSASTALKTYWSDKEKDEKAAFSAGLDLLEKGYLNYQCVEIRAQLERWADNAKNLGLAKRDMQRWEELGTCYLEGRTEGFKEFEKANKKAKLGGS